MNWRTHPAVIWARSALRRSGLHRPIGRLLSRAGYEDRFRRAMLGALRPGDVVWDVGANVGLYSLEFAERVGQSGRVVAFEPSPTNFATLEARVQGHPNVTPLQLALGAEAGTAGFRQGSDPLGATSQLTDAAGASEHVPVARGADLVDAGVAQRPNAIKIDTEGYELEVLLGLGGLLEDPLLRVLCIEVHFGLLAERGLHRAPERIEKALAAARFAVSWADASHIVAQRPVA